MFVYLTTKIYCIIITKTGILFYFLIRAFSMSKHFRIFIPTKETGKKLKGDTHLNCTKINQTLKR